MESGERRLAAVLVADVVGYSRMMAEDEDGTLAALKAHLNVIEPVVLNHGGRVVKTTGDGLLVEFPSAVAALRLSIEVQELMLVRNREIPESRRMQFRVGINLADVIVDESGDIFGDGVNIAARVETSAEPGGVSITDAVYQAAIGKVDVEFTDTGSHVLKNIERPVRLWKVGVAASPNRSTTKPESRILATVAVLPFQNMSTDPEQEYFGDGITEDLLTALSYDQDLAVVARSSTFAYKGRATDIRTVARALDATHVVEGSVRKSGERVRVTAQLIDAESGQHIWAQRYDRDLVDIFDVQDELVEAIASTLTPALWSRTGNLRSKRDGPSFDAWDLTIQGQFHVNTFKVEDVLEGIQLFDRARQLEPDLVAPIARSALAWMFLAWSGWRSGEISPWEKGLADSMEAYRLDKDDYWALSAASLASGIGGNTSDGIAHARRMIEINPYGTFGHHMLGNNLDKAGEHVEAIESLSRAWQLGRHEPLRWDIANDLAYAHFMSGNYEPALTWGSRSLSLVDEYLQVHIVMAAIHAKLGRATEGRRHVDAVLAARPDFSAGKQRSRLSYLLDDDLDHLVDALRRAGLPE